MYVPLFLGIIFLWVVKRIIIFTIALYATSTPDLYYKINESKGTYLNEQEKLDKRRQKAMGFGFNINSIFNVLYVLWFVLCILFFI